MAIRSLTDQVYSTISPARKKDFKRWADLFEKHCPGGLGRAEAYIRQYAEANPKGVQCSTMAGADWHDKPPLQAIYDALKNDGEDSPRFFMGLILWKVLAEHPDTWSFYRPEKGNMDDDSNVPGLIYWRVEPTT